MLTQLDQLAALVARCNARILEVSKPFEPYIQRLQTIEGVGRRSAEVLASEIGVDLSRFSTARSPGFVGVHCPGSYESAGKRRNVGRVREIIGLERRSSSPHGQRPAPARVTWARNSDVSASVAARNEPGSPWSTASSLSPTTCSATAWTSTISEPTTSTG